MKKSDENAEINILISTQAKPTYDKSKQLALNLVNKYDAHSLATDTSFSIIAGRTQPSLLRGGSILNGKIDVLETLSGLEHNIDSPAVLKRALEFAKSNLFSSCSIQKKCSTKPKKTLLLFVDGELDSVNKRFVKDLSNSGVNVIVVVTSDTPTKDIFPDTSLGENSKVLVYPVVDESTGDSSLSIVDLIEDGKFVGFIFQHQPN